MSNLIKKRADISVSDGTTMNMYIAYPEAKEKLPGILVFQEAFGVNAHIRDVTDRIAAEGYIAIAPELYHRTAPGFEGSYTDFASVGPHMQATSKATLEADIKATYDYFIKMDNVQADKIASIGFCMGGRVSFQASTLLPLKAAACFYGAGIAEGLLGDIGKIKTPLLLCWGGQDKHITKDKVDVITDALTQHEKDFVNVIYSKANHAFFCDARASYHPVAAAEAWALVKEFWKIHLK
jgi:carboxymethylenebutenolidase